MINTNLTYRTTVGRSIERIQQASKKIYEHFIIGTGKSPEEIAAFFNDEKSGHINKIRINSDMIISVFFAKEFLDKQITVNKFLKDSETNSTMFFSIAEREARNFYNILVSASTHSFVGKIISDYADKALAAIATEELYFEAYNNDLFSKQYFVSSLVNNLQEVRAAAIQNFSYDSRNQNSEKYDKALLYYERDVDYSITLADAKLANSYNDREFERLLTINDSVSDMYKNNVIFKTKTIYEFSQNGLNHVS